MKTIAGGLLFFGLFSLVLSSTMIGDTAIVGALVSGVSILSSVGLWFGATEVVRMRSDVRSMKKTSFPTE
ncbi:MAG: hypothetical protein LPJ96_08105 [Exiguobacterium sp.]|uniref:hypothetical protein n=1 Tax=Exiguobacterium TaxID=33986 RepID=UPI0004A9544E|nr:MULTISPECIES: hypothetical protein [Exiguobacterium]MDX5323559.1 hypothetical protein [Exiguobacterium sp.]KDN57954.1 membrane protein [Exiguobacterium sp. AB2]MCT4784461.1 hypothetical protein [Exiguobacterium himgiriensis]MDX5425358.1 hypothetical protein [Exiguobacterium sp.]MDX6772776.1 hypothetical protein [Exiguobacterium sp.]